MTGDQIKVLRKERGLSQGALAKELNVHQTAVSQWEVGKTTPDLQTLQTIADFFSVSVDFLLGNVREADSLMALKEEDQELWNLREELRRNPEMRTLFDVSKNAKPDDLRKAIRIIEALKDESEFNG